MVNIKFLLDTNIVSDPIRPKPNRQLLQQMRSHEGEMAIGAIVWHELLFGAQRLPLSKKRTAIERYLTEVVALTLPVLPYDARAAAWHASERARLSAVGQTPAFADGQIAAIAAVNDLTIVTGNTTDFTVFNLPLENWRV